MSPDLCSPQAIERLRIERRSFIAGTIVVWLVILVAEATLFLVMNPGLLNRHDEAHALEAVAAAQKAMPQAQRTWIGLVQLVGAIALFVLNWRFSAEMRRPRSAFPPRDPGAAGGASAAPAGYAASRWLWWIALALNSAFFSPQVIVTPLLAYWGKQEIAERVAACQPQPGTNSGPSL